MQTVLQSLHQLLSPDYREFFDKPTECLIAANHETHFTFWMYSKFAPLLNQIRFLFLFKKITKCSEFRVLSFNPNFYNVDPLFQIVSSSPASELKFIADYCYAGVYAELLLDGYGFKTDAQWRTIEFVKKVS